MTPLEEIEQAIAEVLASKKTSVDADELTHDAIAAALYQARAIERLEATVRAIGVLLQSEYRDAASRREDNRR